MPDRDLFIEEAFRREGSAVRYRSHPPSEVLAEYAAGELGESEALDLAVHVSSCPECLQELSGLRRRWEQLTERLVTQLPEPEQLREAPQKREIARRVREFLAAHRPQELDLFEGVWELLQVKTLSEIALARPQPVRGAASETICVSLISTLAAVFEDESAKSLSEIPKERVRTLIERRARERNLSENWTQRLVEFLL
jgi:anti-sigma factor RsiW